MSVVVRYSVLRFMLLAAVALGLYAVGLRGLPWLLLTAFISIALSFVLLRAPRDQMTQAIIERQHARLEGRGRRTRLDDDAAAEDAADDARRTAGEDEGRRPSA